MKTRRLIITLVTLAVMVGLFITYSQPGTLTSKDYVVKAPHKNKIIADTLLAHKIKCLSRNGLIERVLFDGKWVDVLDVELVNHTLILRTDAVNISLAAVIDNLQPAATSHRFQKSESRIQEKTTQAD